MNDRDHTDTGTDRGRTPADEGTEDTSRDPQLAAVPNPEALGEVPATLAPTGAPTPFVPPGPVASRDTRWLALAVAVGIAVMLLIVALILWL
jgi:hypothetical protein